MEFLCFVEYDNIKKIGFPDRRDTTGGQELYPFSEYGDKIAFLTRKFTEEGEWGDVHLNILVIDSYSVPMKFELHTTHYEANMGEGVGDDIIQKAFVMQVTSVRGLDVAIVAQYNDRIIYDCITSTRQQPIRFPLPPKNKEEEARLKDPDFAKEDAEWEDLTICRSGTMIKQQMLMDDKGAIYFMMLSDNGTVRVLRTDPQIEMGGEGFIKPVFSFRSSKVYFFLF